MGNDRLQIDPDSGQMPVSPRPAEREWTFMVYMAGDNNLEEFGRGDLKEMKQVGSTPQVAVVAQFDKMQGGATRRYLLAKGTALESDELSADLGETNTGDPRDLAQFVGWAASEYPAKRYALVLWNHGVGWKEDDIYRRAAMSAVVSAQANRYLSPLIQRIVAARRPILFSTTVDSILARGIGYDDTSGDFLDNAEMKRAIGCGLLGGGIPKLDVLGFDACLMSMLEIAYQVKDQTCYVVGSQENEPAEGWPYAQVLGKLVAAPEMSAADLAETIVDAYGSNFEPGENITQSALDLSQLGEVVAALNEFAAYVLEHLSECELIIGRASRRAQSFADPDYKDLYDLCRLIYERSDALPELKGLVAAVMNVLEPAAKGRFVSRSVGRGPRMSQVHGVSIYLPRYELSPFYKKLDFASECLWDDMLHALLGV